MRSDYSLLLFHVFHILSAKGDSNLDYWLLKISSKGISKKECNVVLILRPAAGAVAMVWIIGAYALIFGLVMIVFAFRLRDLQGWLEKLV